MSGIVAGLLFAVLISAAVIAVGLTAASSIIAGPLILSGFVGVTASGLGIFRLVSKRKTRSHSVSLG